MAAPPPSTRAAAGTNVFCECHIVFVPSRQLPCTTITELQALASRYGAEILEPDEDGRIAMENVTHIIANSIDFPQYDEALAVMVPVVSSTWISHSISRNKQAQIRPFSPDPRIILSHYTVTCADIPLTDKEAITGATLALGGAESKDLTRLTTHICALSLDNDKCQTALTKGSKCKIVLPHWFDDCFKLGKRIDEGPYLLPDPEILRKRPEDEVQIPPSQHMEGASKTIPDVPPIPDPDCSRGKLTVFRKKKVMLSWDLSISKRFRDTVADLIRGGEGELTTDVETCDFFICQYREGAQYVRAAQCGKDVGNLAWLFYLVTHNEWCSPLRRLLHYPVPKDGIPGFKDLTVALSNYGGEARVYLENLIKAAGATYTKTMRDTNTHLVTARDHSEKCDAAREWNISMANHLWIEESYAKCEVQALTNRKYTTFPPRTNLGEIIGQTFFDEGKLRSVYYPGGEDTMDSQAKRKKKVLQAAQDNAYKIGPAAAMVVGKPDQHQIDVLRDDDANDAEPVEEAAKLPAIPTTTRSTRSYATPARRRHVGIGKENDTPSVMSSGSRTAKDRAISKLHGLAPDIALYEKEKKRSSNGPWGGKRAADQFEKEQEARSSSPTRVREAAEDDEDDDEEEEEDGEAEAHRAKRPSKRQKTSLPPVEMRIVVTLFERWTGDNSKEEADKKKLRNLGIQIVQDSQPCDYLAAPHLARTEKFLKALARGPTVINSKFIEDVLEQGKILPTKDYALKDKQNEAKFDVKLQKAVVRARANRGRLLWKLPIYCTENIANGVGCYKAIAEANGAIFKIYRARSGTTIKPTTAEEDGGAEPEPVYLLSSASAAERALWPKFEKMAREGHMEPRVVSSDWLLSVALRQELDFDEEYLVSNFWST